MAVVMAISKKSGLLLFFLDSVNLRYGLTQDLGKDL